MNLKRSRKADNLDTLLLPDHSDIVRVEWSGGDLLMMAVVGDGANTTLFLDSDDDVRM